MLPLLLILASADPFAKDECNRCHDGVGAPAKLEKHCTSYHDAIRDGTWNAPTELMDEWRPNLRSFAAVPSLEDLHGFRRGWVMEFLMKPHDVRPNLNGMMPRFPMTPADAVAMTRRLVKVRGDEPMPAFAAERIAEGRRLFAELDCGSCHAYSGVLPARARSGDAPAMLLAPDLRHTRARLQPSFVRAFIADPSARSKALMPRFDLTDAQAEALTAFVLGEEIGPLPEDPMPSRLPLLDRRVGF